MMIKPLLLLACCLSLLPAASARADETRHWIARVGVHPIDPKPDNHASLNVDSAVALSFGATYLFTKHWGLELFGAIPAEHDLRDANAARVGSFDLLPVTATVQYHISDARDRVRGYVGAGVSFASFGDEQFTGSSLSLGHSTGLAATIGLDMNLGRRWFANVDARWFDMDAPLAIGGADFGRLELDPFAFGLSLGRRLR